MTCAASPTRRYLGVYLPWLPAERAMHARAMPRDAAFALVASVANANRVVAVSPRAAALGIVGLTLADARAREPRLVTVADHPAADAAWLDRLADGCDRYSPTVAVAPPDVILIDLTGSLGPFPGEAALAADLRDRLARCGVTTVTAAATTPDAAAALARFGVADAADLPVAALAVAPDIHAALRRAGLTTIGDLATRPQAPLAARFGDVVPTLVARLTGRDDIRLVPRRVAPALAFDHRFVDPVADTVRIMPAVDRLLAAAAAHLAAHAQGGKRFDLALFRCDGHVARLSVATDQPTRDPAVVMRLFEERIDSLGDPLDPGFGYDLVRLAVPIVDALGEVQLDFVAPPAIGTDLGPLLDRLATRLGPARVRRLATGDSHIPERASSDRPYRGGGADLPRCLAPAEPPHRPVQLFTPPQPIDVLAEVPDGPPRAFTWRRQRHGIVRAEGPERIALEWWREAGGEDGDAAATRDYYRLEDEDGRRFWVFRHGLFGAAAAPPGWYLHGLFA